MGIRIHKAMGYGFDGLVDEQYEPDYADEPNIEEFLNWCITNEKQIEELFMSGPYRKPDEWKWHRSDLKLSYLKQFDSDKNLETRSINDFIHYDPEFGLPNVILFRPIGFGDWFRYDDIIDYMEASRNEDGPFNELVKLCDTPSIQEPHQRIGIFPYMFRRPPPTIAAMCIWAGLEDIYLKLQESIYTWWG